MITTFVIGLLISIYLQSLLDALKTEHKDLYENFCKKRFFNRGVYNPFLFLFIIKASTANQPFFNSNIKRLIKLLKMLYALQGIFVILLLSAAVYSFFE